MSNRNGINPNVLNLLSSLDAPVGTSYRDQWKQRQDQLAAEAAALANPPQPQDDGFFQRSAGELAGDLGSGLAKGVNSVGGAIVQNVDAGVELQKNFSPLMAVMKHYFPERVAESERLYTNVAEGVGNFFKSGEDYWQDNKSDKIKADAAYASGGEGFTDTVGRVLERPQVIPDLVADSAAYMLPGGWAARAIAATGASKGAVVAGSMGVGAALDAGATGMQAKREVLNMTPEQLMERSPDYKVLIDSGISPQEAKLALARDAGFTAQAIQLPISFLASKLTGAGKIESDFFTGQGVKNFFSAILRETAEEGIQESSAQVATNIGVQQNADETRSLTQDVGKNAALGMVAGGAQAGGMKALGAFVPGSRGTAPDANDDGIDVPVDGPLNSPSNDPLQLQYNPERMITMPDGTTAWESELADLNTDQAAKQHPAYASPIVSTGDQSNPDDRFKFELNTESLRSRVQSLRAKRRDEMDRVNRTGKYTPLQLDYNPERMITMPDGTTAWESELSDLNADQAARQHPSYPSQAGYDAQQKVIEAQAVSKGIDDARNARMPENLKDTRLLRNRYRTHLTNVADSLEPNAAAFSSPDSLLDMAAKNGGLNAAAWASEGIDPADAKASNSGFSKVFRKNGGMTPDDLAEFAHQNGFTGFSDAQGNLDANAALNAVNDELSGNKRYSLNDESALQAAQNAPAYVSELKEFGSPEAIKRAISLALEGKKLGNNQLKIVQEVLNNTNTHSRDDKAIKEKWADRAKTMLANRGNKELNSWRNRDEHEADATTHEAALNELMTEAIENYGIDPDAVKNAYRNYAEKYPTQGQLTAAMTSWVSANKPNTSEHLSYEQQNRKTELPRGSSSQRGAPLSGAGLSPESQSGQASGESRVNAPSSQGQPGSDSTRGNTGLRQPVDFSLESQTEESAKAESDRLAAIAKADEESKAKAEQKAQADLEVGSFALSGSNAPSDVAASYGQNDMFVGARGSKSKSNQETGEDENQLPPLAEGFEKSLLRARPLAKKLGIPNYNQMKLAELVPAIKAKYSEKKAEPNINQVEPKQEAKQPRPSDGVSVSGPQESKSKNYGAKNKLVSSDRAAELREKLKAKLNNLNSGIDPETLAIGTELAVYHIEAGTRSFVEFARAMAGDLGTTIDKIRPYLRSWYNGARDMMEDSGHNVDGMSSPDEVRESLKTLSDKKEGAKPENTGRLADYLLPRLSEITGNTALRKAVKEFSGARELQDVTPEMMKMAQEHLEMALVMNAREIVASAKSDKEAFDKLLASYENQPLLNVRSSTSMENQAYSTPAPLAFLAGRLAGINSDGTVYEPTAGNGMLLIGAAPENVYANELDGNRAVHLKHLGFKTTEKDGSEYLPKGKMDSAIMNPPFGNLDKFGKPSAVQYDGYTVKKIDHLITMKALESIKDDGRASIIIGANKEAGVIGNGAERVFLNWLYSHYNVVDHFEVDGDLYRRQGAGWPVRVITVNGRLESKEFAPKSGSIPRFDNWNDVYEHSKQVLDSERFRAERHRENVSEHEPQTGNNVGSNAANAIENSTPDGRSGSGTRGERAGVARDGRKLPKSDNGNGKPASNSGNVSEGGHDNQHGNQLTPKSDAGERQSAQLGLDRVGERTDVSPTDGSGGSNRKPVLGGGASEFQAEYKAASNGFNDSVLTPKNMADATQNALSHIQDEVGNIDDYVASKLEYKSTEDMHEGLMALQVDTVAAAIYNVEKRGKGIIIADQTGVGKGRQAAALIRYAILNGMTPIFVTVKPNLYSDMYGDLLDIGSKNAKPFVTNADTGIEHNGETLFNGKGKAHKDKIQSIIDNGALPAGHDMLFTTYDQLKGDSNNLRRAAISAIQKPFFILDEAHNAAGEMYSEKKVNGVKTKVTTTAGFVYESLKDKPVVYLSATYAKRPDNMPIYYRTDLLDAVDTPQELVDAVNAGGVPLQQVVASMLASNGQLFRRERSFAGIKMNFLKDSSNVSEQERISDEVNKGLRAVVDASGAFAEWYEHNHREIEPPGGSTKLAGNKADSMAGSVNPFTSVVHNYIRQLLLGIKAEKAATKAIELYKSGKKPVIALENTMGSFLAEYVEKNKLKVGDPINFNYNDILKVALERTRRVSFKNDKGDSVPLPIELHQLDPMTRLIYSQAEEEINDIDLSALPASPIDFMLSEMRKAGMSVGEITGRGYFVDYSGAMPVLGMRTKKEKDERRKTVDNFNNGKIDALILNSAGSTGLSIHASERFKDQSPRHMIIAQPMLDINTLMQMLGRINRTGQVELPEFTFLSLDLPAEIRPTATTKAKMAKLNANTSANDKSDTSFESPDFMNKYGDQVVNEFLQDNPDIEVATGIYSSENAQEDMALKFTGRLALLDAKIQRRVMAEILEAYGEKIEYLNKTGQNDLVAQDLKLDAYIQDSKIVHEGKDPESVFGGHTTLHKVNVKYLGKPPTADDVASAIDDALEGETPEKAMSQIIHGKDSDEKYLRDLEGRFKEAAADREKKLADVAAHEKAGGTSDADDKKRNKLQNSLTSAESRLNTAKDAITAYHSGRDNMRDTLSRVLKIGNRIRVDVGDENVNAVIVGVKDTHKPGSGNPWAPSKVRITMMVNSGVRQISVNYKQLMGKDGLFIESLRGSGKDGLVDVFKKDLDENRREIRYIATGNLIAGSAKLDGGKITSFTDSDGNTHQGILMPRKYGKKGEYEQGNSVSSVVVRDASVLAKYLNLGGQFSEIGAFSPDKAIKVSSGRDGSLVISVPIANKNKAAFAIKLDDDLRKIVGDFYGSSQTQTAKIPAGKERAALTRLMELTPLSIPAKMRDSLVAVGGDEAPDAVHSFDGKNVQSGKAPKGEIVGQESAEPFRAEENQSPSSDATDKPNGKIIAGKFHSNAPEKIYTTKKGKDISGVIAYGVSLDDVKSEVDQYAWKMDGGVFIRMSHIERPSGDIKYKHDTKTTKSISRESAQAVIDRISKDWKVKVKINLIGSIDELPDSVKSRLHKADDEQGEPAALIDESTGHVYINLSKAASERSIEELIFHEVYTHFGLRQLMGANVSGLMTRLYLNLGKTEFDRLAKKYDVNTEAYKEAYADKPQEYVQAILAEELLAHMAEHPRPAVVRIANEFIGAVRAWLRSSGFMELAKISEADMRYLLKQSRETVTKGKQGNISGLIYSLAGISKADRAAIGKQPKSKSYDDAARNEDLITMWATISRDEESFQLPFSRKKDFVEIAQELEGFNGFTSYEADELALMNKHKAENAWRVVTPKGEKAAVFQSGDKVWVDVSDLSEGEGGRRIYNMVANYAYNNKKVFMGDPAGLSITAKSRRLENMLSSALKFGTTDHLQPHRLQLVTSHGVPGLKWKKGDTENNILEMIRASYESVKNQFPEIENLVYNPVNDRFESRETGEEVTKNELSELANRKREVPAQGKLDGEYADPARGGASGKITAGRTTIERAILTGSVLRGTRSEASRLLDKLSEQRSERLTGDNAILYSLPNTQTRSQGGFSASELGKKIPFVRDRIARQEQMRSLPPSMQESFSRLGQNKTFIDKFTSEVKRQLTPAGLLPAPVFDLKVVRDGEINGDGMQTKHTLQGFYDAVEKAYGMPYKDLKRGTKREINKVLRGEPNAQLSPSVISALGKMRDDIKRLSAIHVRQLAEDAADLQAQGKDAEAASKLAMLETISQNFDTYLHRSYRAFDDKNWPDKVPASVYQDAVNFLASEYADGGAVTADHIKTAEKRAHMILHEGTAFDSMGAFISESKLGAKDLSIMKKRKDVPAPIRALLGEYEDAAMNYVKSVTKMSRLVHNHAFLISMKQTAFDLGLLHDKQNLELDVTKKIAADASEAYAPLNGLYTTREFEQALKDVMGKHNPIPIYDAIVAVNGMVKMGKTVLAPTTAMRNFMSSLFFTLSNGHFNYSHAAKSFKAAQVYFMERGDQGVKDYMIKLRRLGVIYDSPYASEMMDLMKDAKLEGFIESGGNPLANGAKWALQWSQKFYSFGDDFYKIIGFENEKALLMKHRGLTEAQAEKEAAERIRNTYPTYSMIGKGINALRRFPLVGTFVSFPAEIIRTSYNITKYLKDDIKAYGLKDPIVQRKLAGYAIAAGLISGISMLSASMAGVDDDEEAAIRAMAPQWQKNSTFLWLWKDENGNRVYVDLSFLDPYGYWKRPITAAMQDQPIEKAVLSGATDLLSPFLSWDIAAKAIGESAFNGKVEGGKVYNESDSAGGIALSVTNHLRKAVQPGIATNVERFILAGMGEKSKTGKPYKTSEEVAALFGWRAATFDPKVALYYQAFEYQDNKSNASKILSSVASSTNSVSDDELRAAYEQSMKARAKAFDDMGKIVNAAKSSGMSNLQLLGALRNSGVSVADSRALISGKPPVFAPSKTMMKGAIKKSAVLFDTETQAEFKRREKYLNDLRSKSGAAHLLDSD